MGRSSVLRKIFQRRKKPEPEPEAAPKDSPDTTERPSLSGLLSGTSGELHALGLRYAMASIIATDDQEVIALRTASLRLERLARQFSMSSNLIASRRIDEEVD